jgi:hypothetical protein
VGAPDGRVERERLQPAIESARGDSPGAACPAYARVPGAPYRIPSEAISTAAQAGTVLRNLLLCYLSAFLFQLGQRAACNSLHTATHRCCRWLLLTCDQADCDALPLTQTGVSKLMGLRRPTVTEVFQHPRR